MTLIIPAEAWMVVDVTNVTPIQPHCAVPLCHNLFHVFIIVYYCLSLFIIHMLVGDVTNVTPFSLTVPCHCATIVGGIVEPSRRHPDHDEEEEE